MTVNDGKSGLVLWTRKECADYLRMAEGTLRNLGDKGPARLKLGRQTYYRPESVEKWLELRER
jgi:hypothetical protein